MTRLTPAEREFLPMLESVYRRIEESAFFRRFRPVMRMDPSVSAEWDTSYASWSAIVYVIRRELHIKLQASTAMGKILVLQQPLGTMHVSDVLEEQTLMLEEYGALCSRHRRMLGEEAKERVRESACAC